MKTLSNIIKIGLLALSLIAVATIFFMGSTGVDIILYWSYILIGLALVAAIVFPLVNIATNPKGAMRSLIGIAIIAIVVIVCYSLGNDDPMLLSDKTVYTNGFGLKLSDTELYASYIALGAALLLAIVGEIRNSLK